ncbi:hypothetical protein PR048_023128 [Dryococelus australis]|uniref:Pyridoxal kinase n=1 Tax=Dryococelus australis TaxID=614101 RepID=A0ABQ9GT81_9NEOP|nr:hypothetical protein PR048_023128 [Dryococelus australis]
MSEECPRVFSIQSHVVSGYVGNKSAVFPLQVLGFEVDAINSVQFSNHTGYPSFHGQVLNETELDVLLKGLQENGLDKYTHLLTGYVGSPSFLRRIAALVQHLRKVNPKLIYVLLKGGSVAVCDPVMGDNGRMYVSEELLPIYRDTILPLADIIVPNQFEVELLTGRNVTSVAEAWEAVQLFHDKGIKTVVLTSTGLGTDSHLLALASSTLGGTARKMSINIPKFSATFTGTGDLFAALLLAWMHRTKGDLKSSIENVIHTMQAVLTKTMKHVEDCSQKGIALTAAHNELKLIQSIEEMKKPLPTLLADIH